MEASGNDLSTSVLPKLEIGQVLYDDGASVVGLFNEYFINTTNIRDVNYVLSQRQILGTGNLPQDSAPVCIYIDISPGMAAQSAQRNQAFYVTTSA